MQIAQKYWNEQGGWKDVKQTEFSSSPNIVLVFGGRAVLEDPSRYEEIKQFYPKSHIIMCSTAGEILRTEVSNDSLSVTAVLFEKTKLEFVTEEILDASQSLEKGKSLASKLPKEGLNHVMVFSEGLKVNGTALVNGLIHHLPKSVAVTGGLVGDGADFKKTLLGLDEVPTSGRIIVVGFYGDSLKVGYGSLGGWDSFGVERKITKSTDNVLYELDGKPALALYKEYLGDQAKDLPSSGLLFPLSLSIKQDNGEFVEVVRTLLSVNEEENSMTFAGDMPEGVSAKLMKANFERLVDGAQGAAEMSSKGSNLEQPELAILISCVGRKLVLKERTAEEVEAVQEELGPQATITGFYSYGEISPSYPTEQQCQLYNQTMTITTFKEE